MKCSAEKHYTNFLIFLVDANWGQLPNSLFVTQGSAQILNKSQIGMEYFVYKTCLSPKSNLTLAWNVNLKIKMIKQTPLQYQIKYFAKSKKIK